MMVLSTPAKRAQAFVIRTDTEAVGEFRPRLRARYFRLSLSSSLSFRLRFRFHRKSETTAF